jgi:hypothetical protein
MASSKTALHDNRIENGRNQSRTSANVHGTVRRGTEQAAVDLALAVLEVDTVKRPVEVGFLGALDAVRIQECGDASDNGSHDVFPYVEYDSKEKLCAAQ